MPYRLLRVLPPPSLSSPQLRDTCLDHLNNLPQPGPYFTQQELREAEADLSAACGSSVEHAMRLWELLSTAARAERSGEGASPAARAAAADVLRGLRRRREGELRRALRCIDRAVAAETEAAVAARLRRALGAFRSVTPALRDIRGDAPSLSTALLPADDPEPAAAAAEQPGGGGGGTIAEACAVAAQMAARLEAWAAERGGAGASLAADAAGAASSGTGKEQHLNETAEVLRSLSAEQLRLQAVGVTPPIDVLGPRGYAYGDFMVRLRGWAYDSLQQEHQRDRWLSIHAAAAKRELVECVRAGADFDESGGEDAGGGGGGGGALGGAVGQRAAEEERHADAAGRGSDGDQQPPPGKRPRLKASSRLPA